MSNIWFYKEFVPKYYIMDPKEEDLLFDGRALKDGMIVLIDEPPLRIENPNNRPLPPHELEIANQYNRWTQVTGDVLIETSKIPNTLMFIGTFHDQTKKKFIVPAYHAWFVKKDTMPQEWD